MRTPVKKNRYKQCILLNESVCPGRSIHQWYLGMSCHEATFIKLILLLVENFAFTLIVCLLQELLLFTICMFNCIIFNCIIYRVQAERG